MNYVTAARTFMAVTSRQIEQVNYELNKHKVNIVSQVGTYHEFTTRLGSTALDSR